jgi:RNA polymerase sigma-70 factor, ECF subfamily
MVKHSNRNIDPFVNRQYNDTFRELYTPLCRFVMKFGIDAENAEDIVQDLFIYLLENWARLSNISSIKSYMFTAAKNQSISYMLKPFSEKKRIDLSIVRESAPHINPQDIFESKELESIIEKALEALPHKCHTIFTLKRFGEFSNKEIAEKLHISVKTVEAQMTIALKKMYAFISTRWELIILFLIERLHTFF